MSASEDSRVSSNDKRVFCFICVKERRRVGEEKVHSDRKSHLLARLRLTGMNYFSFFSVFHTQNEIERQLLLLTRKEVPVSRFPAKEKPLDGFSGSRCTPWVFFFLFSLKIQLLLSIISDAKLLGYLFSLLDVETHHSIYLTSPFKLNPRHATKNFDTLNNFVGMVIQQESLYTEEEICTFWRDNIVNWEWK